MNQPPILTIFAHPDDETMLIGGTLRLLAEQGCAVHYVCATRGEGGETGEPPICKQEDLGTVREGELVCAVQALGGRSLTFLGYVDPLVGPDNALYPYTDDLTTLSGQIAASIRQFRPAALITHGSSGEYGHPAHVLTWQAAFIAVQSLGAEAPALYCVSGMWKGHPRPRIANQDQEAHFVLDIAPVMEHKIRAAMCHKSQHALFTRRTSQGAGRPLSVAEAVGSFSVESLHRALPADGPLDDPLAQLLRRLPNVTVRREH